MNVSDAVASRRSVRGFLDKPVDKALLHEAIERAARAPSGGNLQPWHIHVVTGERLAQLKDLMRTLITDTPPPLGEGSEYDIYPRKFASPYKERAAQIGEALYNSIVSGVFSPRRPTA